MQKLVAGLLIATALWSEALTFGPREGAKFSFEVYKTGLMSGKKHDFTFDRFSGKADFRPEDPGKSRVEFVLEAKSLQCHDDWSPAKGSLEKIVREALQDTLKVVQHPEIRFQSTAVTAGAAGQYEVRGDLTLRGVTKPVTVQVSTRRKGNVLTVDGHSKFKMTDFGIKPPSAALGAVGTKPEIQVTFQMVTGS